MMPVFAGPRSPDAPGRSMPEEVRRLVRERDGDRCLYCGALGADDVDHVFPWSQGGTHDPRNLVVCCQVCNSIAGLRVFGEFAAKRAYVLRRRAELGREAIEGAERRVAVGGSAGIE